MHAPPKHSRPLPHPKHESPQWKKEISHRMREMDAGKKVTLAELKQRMAKAP